tara:strand:- start:1085 stop:1837 length:753 start_codon:yes stop_codon:yes gene_type:complete
MKLIRLGQSLCEGSSFPPPPPTANALLFLKHNTNMYGDLEDDCVTPANYSSNDSTFVKAGPISSWEDYNGVGNYAEQVDCADRPHYVIGRARFSPGTSNFFDLDIPIVLTGEFTMYIKASLSGTTNKAFLGGDTSNFWRISNNKEFRVRIGGTTNNLFTEVTDTIGTSLEVYVFCLQRDTSGFLSLFVEGGGYSDKSWGSTTNVDTDTMTISNIAATSDDTQTLEGDLYDVLIYDTKHGTIQRNIIYDYL